MTADRSKIVNFLKKYLDVENIKDSSQNGLQVEGKEKIKHIVFGISACRKLFEQAVKNESDMVIVHHGLIWDKPFKITGFMKERIKVLLDHDINFLAYHLPLDKHPKCGNNIKTIKIFDVENIKPFGIYEGEYIGYKADFKKPMMLKKIKDILRQKLNTRLQCADFGSQRIKNLAVVTGGAGSIVYQAAQEKIDLFITGETAEYAWELCRENKFNLIAAGHYNTEKAGVLALADVLRKKFKVKTKFIDIPNPF